MARNPNRIGQAFLVANCPIMRQSSLPHYFFLFFIARLPGTVLSVLGGWLVFSWAKSLYGSMAGVLALALWVTSPNIASWACTLTADLGASVIGLAASYAFWEYLKRPGFPRGCLAAVLLGLPFLSKFTLLIFCGVWPTLAVGARLMLGRDREKTNFTNWNFKSWSVTAEMARWVLYTVIVLFVVNWGYAFEGSGTPLEDFRFESSMAENVQHAAERMGLARLPVAVPRYFLLVLGAQREDF